jgi:hypothetical protein
MMSPQEEEYIREKAYLPEHILPLMMGISQAEPFLEEDYLFFYKNKWLLCIGYPLEHEFEEDRLFRLLKKTQKKIQPASTWLIAPRIPEGLLSAVQQKETDEYYRLDLKPHEGKRNLLREVEKAARSLRVEKGRAWAEEYGTLTQEVLGKEGLHPRVKELYLRMPQYLAHSETSLLLGARDSGGNLSAFLVIELGAKQFATYVVGGHSRENYVSHASDLLFYEMIRLAREEKKEYLHLGLGVNAGIRRFKRKWGGVPFLRYEFGELNERPQGPLSWLQALQGKL